MNYFSNRCGAKRIYQTKFTVFGQTFDQEISCHVGQAGRRLLELIEKQLNESLDIEEIKNKRAV